MTGLGANISEIQMYDHDEECVFSMLTRIELDPGRFDELRDAMVEVSQRTELSIRTWSPESTADARGWPFVSLIVRSRPWPCCEPFATGR